VNRLRKRLRFDTNGVHSIREVFIGAAIGDAIESLCGIGK